MVGRAGFEPAKSETADLQSAPFGHFGIYPFLEGTVRLGCWPHLSKPVFNAVGKNSRTALVLFFLGSYSKGLQPLQGLCLPGFPHGPLVTV